MKSKICSSKHRVWRVLCQDLNKQSIQRLAYKIVSSKLKSLPCIYITNREALEIAGGLFLGQETPNVTIHGLKHSEVVAFTAEEIHPGLDIMDVVGIEPTHTNACYDRETQKGKHDVAAYKPECILFLTIWESCWRNSLSPELMKLLRKLVFLLRDSSDFEGDVPYF